MAFWGADKGLAAGDEEGVTIPPLCRAWHGPRNLTVAETGQIGQSGHAFHGFGTHKRRDHIPNGFAFFVRQGQIPVNHFSV